MASKRTNWCEFDKETRKHIKKRDNNRCIVCGRTGALQMAHIFISRAKGGRGDKKNGVLLCVEHHNILDNYIGKEQAMQSYKIAEYCKKYLIEKEKIIYMPELLKELKFDKTKVEIKPINIETIQKKLLDSTKTNAIERKTPLENNWIKKCKNCKLLVKNKFNSNNSLPSYYCKYKKICLNKNTKACEKYDDRKIIR